MTEAVLEATQSKTRICGAAKRDPITGLMDECYETVTKGQKCRKSSEHLNRYKTGFCGNGDCEGLKPKCNGVALPTCTAWLACPCDCHDLMSRIFEIADMPRIVVLNPEYVPGPKLHFEWPDPKELQEARLESSRSSVPTEVIPSEDEHLPFTVLRKFEPTVTGRAARGELEQNVKQACDAWVKLGDFTIECTTRWIQDWIAAEKSASPSRGAIDAVFKRWEQIQFAFFMQSPVRFVCYTPDGIKFGLDEMKNKSKPKKFH